MQLESPDTSLEGPGLPPGDPQQIAWSLLDTCGLTFFFSGPGTAAEAFEALRAKSPVLNHLEVRGSGHFAMIPGRNDFAVTAYNGPTRGVIAISNFPEGDARWGMEQGLGGHVQAPEPYVWGFGTLNAQVPGVIAKEIRTGRLVNLRTFRGLSVAAGVPQEQPSETPPMSDGVQQQLIEDGWEQVGPEAYKGVVPGLEGRSQLLFLVSTKGAGWALCSPICDAVDGAIPDPVRALNLPHDLDVFGDLVVIKNLLEGYPEEPTQAAVMAQAMSLARTADALELQITGRDDF